MNTALIGVGTITQNYYLGLSKSKDLKLVALVDVDINPIGKKFFPHLPLYKSIDEMFFNHEIECVIISTPPSEHFHIIKQMLEKKVDVIVEKPTVLDIIKFEELILLSQKKCCLFNTCFHWQHGSEVRAFNRMYKRKNIESIFVHVDDPYSLDGRNINEDKIKLSGAFIDSGVNALSLVKMWLHFKEYKIIYTDIIYAENVHLPIYANVKLIIDNIPVRIEVDWRNNKNQKISELIYEGRKVIIDHSNQKIIDGDQEIIKDKMNRLTRHYYNYFVTYKQRSNMLEAYKIHQVLLEVKKHYD